MSVGFSIEDDPFLPKNGNRFADSLQCQTEPSVQNGCLLWGQTIPKSWQVTFLKSLYDNHPGITRMKAVARSWWIGLDKDIENLGSLVKIVKR